MNTQRMNQLLDQSGLDAIVALSLDNVTYLSGAWILTQRIIPDRLAIVLWPRQGEPVFILSDLEVAPIKDRCTIADARTYFEFKTSPVEMLADAIAEKGLSSGRLGIEWRSMSVAHFEQLRKLLPAAQFDDGAGVMERVRMVKTDEEIEVLSWAANITEQAIVDGFQESTGSDSEKSVGTNIASKIMANGADVMNFNFLGCGFRSVEWHAWPGADKLELGKVITTDVGGSFGGYWSDVARTVIVGPPTPKQRDLFDRLFQVQLKTVEAIKPGLRASDLYRICENAYAEMGLPFWMPHVGHGIGLGLHEYPMINPYVDQELLPGMVLNVEPAHVENGVEGYHVEDLVQVTETGFKPLTNMSRWSELFSID